MMSGDEMVSLLCNLIAIPSVNPCADAECVTVPYGEGRVAEFVSAYFQSYPVAVQRQDICAGRSNILIRAPGADSSAAPLLLEAHMDTVDTEGMREPFTPRIDDGKVFGRGACDTKASLAAMMLALSELLQEKAPLPRDVYLVAAADEEWGMQGIRSLIGAGIPFAGAVVGEPTRLRVVPATLGQVYLQMVAHGKAAHTSTPEKGVNAIYLMTDVIGALRRRTAAEFPPRAHPLCGPPLLCVSIIEGGNSEHVVPSDCRIAIDLRLTPGSTWEQAAVELEGWLAQELDAATLERVEILEPHKNVPPLSTDPSHLMVQALCKASQDALGWTEVAGVPYNTDGSWLSASGVPVAVFGPGDIAQAHGPNEYVSINEVRQAVDVLKRFIMGFIP